MVTQKEWTRMQEELNKPKIAKQAKKTQLTNHKKYKDWTSKHHKDLTSNEQNKLINKNVAQAFYFVSKKWNKTFNFQLCTFNGCENTAWNLKPYFFIWKPKISNLEFYPTLFKYLVMVFFF